MKLKNLKLRSQKPRFVRPEFNVPVRSFLHPTNRKEMGEHAKRTVLKGTILKSTGGKISPGKRASTKSLQRAVKMFKR